jgi:MoxR-like ATPase
VEEPGDRAAGTSAQAEREDALLVGKRWAETLTAEIGKAVLGQHEVVERILVALVAGGNVLLEGMPGLAKTLLVKSVSTAIGLEFERIQFTPDLLPSDVVGTMVYSPRTEEFSPHYGPIFANFVLADEINRAPAKVQSALLEAMGEKQVTMGGVTYALPDPFFVMATQNPIEQEGTYLLPEAQTDRFLLKLNLRYPAPEDELAMLSRWGSVMRKPVVEAVSSGAELQALREALDHVHVAPAIGNYVLALVQRTRELAVEENDGLRLLEFGASPRATLGLYQAARALSLLRGVGYVTPALVQEVAPDVLRHRLGLTYEAVASGLHPDAVVGLVLEQVEIPAP